MHTFLAMICLVSMVIPATLANIFAYPVSKKISVKISNYIEYVCARRVFAIVKTYLGFSLFKYSENLDKLPDQFILISNHQSLLDIPVYFTFFQDKKVRFVAKDVLGRHIPMVSEMLRSQEHCLIPRRAKPMEAMKYLSSFGKRVIERNEIPVIFPEGSRTRDGNVGKFHSAGLRQLSESTNLPVVACALDGGWRLRDLRKIFMYMKKGSYRAKVLKIYDCPKTKEEATQLLEDARILMQNQIDEWRKLPIDKK